MTPEITTAAARQLAATAAILAEAPRGAGGLTDRLAGLIFVRAIAELGLARVDRAAVFAAMSDVAPEMPTDAAALIEVARLGDLFATADRATVEAMDPAAVSSLAALRRLWAASGEHDSNDAIEALRKHAAMLGLPPGPDLILALAEAAERLPAEVPALMRMAAWPYAQTRH